MTWLAFSFSFFLVLKTKLLRSQRRIGTGSIVFNKIKKKYAAKYKKKYIYYSYDIYSHSKYPSTIDGVTHNVQIEVLNIVAQTAGAGCIALEMMHEGNLFEMNK
jgi:hypothetical protein